MFYPCAHAYAIYPRLLPAFMTRQEYPCHVQCCECLPCSHAFASCYLLKKSYLSTLPNETKEYAYYAQEAGHVFPKHKCTRVVFGTCFMSEKDYLSATSCASVTHRHCNLQLKLQGNASRRSTSSTSTYKNMRIYLGNVLNKLSCTRTQHTSEEHCTHPHSDRPNTYIHIQTYNYTHAVTYDDLTAKGVLAQHAEFILMAFYMRAHKDQNLT